ncbi:MAG: hypothetical protein AW12_00336 [Candidatus Accumulibacter sp. BA-94]|uniref:Eco57I restriction-modification methylase domain-containing protein n=1 Tax=Accumulibacter sp. TaxID=2053492 RepID=UPI00044FCC4B|nr:type IIL restriction-modification enzyme MmeI [Accumulibacter sp.]EXI92856.1 MAG: hypothetical protein AW12_00336 [Candidatus Accumulibacter sp. BA-94]HRD86714.1 restriction endonuclease [Accumulibacter sp.]
MSVSRHHADWLSLVEVSGPFVSLPVLLRVFQHGLDPRDPAQAKALRAAHGEWHENPAAPGKQRAWVLHVLTAVLGYPQDQITEGQKLPAGLEAEMPEMGETLRPDFALVGPTGSDTAGQAQLLIASYTVEQTLDKPVIGKHWKATPATRMMELLHGAGVSLGLVTNGEHWMLVYAPRGETTGYASWYGSLWLDEPITLRAFHSLLGVRRFFGVATGNTLLALLKESASDQQEVTDQLGYQVREAVKVLVQSFDALDKESNRVLLTGVNPPVLYDAALTIMMRLVFLFSAEERGLLHLGKPLYDDNYAVSTLQEQLQEVADRYGEEVLERRYDAWARLLATFRAVHGGIQHQDLLMQAYGGSLFDPDRYPFLEGRSAGSAWRSVQAEPLAVNNRVVLHLLNSLQRLRTRVGGAAETRRISFRALGVEQIGHVYEGLLDHTAACAGEPVLGVKGTRSKEPEIPLAKLESLLGQGQEKLIDFLKEETGRSLPAIRRTLEEGSLLDEHKLLMACNQDHALLARLLPFAGIIREDSFERPLVVLAGSVYVTAGTTRRSTGTHYTPPSLTEPIAQHTLEPLVYEGPAEGWPREQWALKSPKAILDLKVCDMAMGSGAFLVQVCRYLAERLTEAWENEEKKHPGQVLITPDGKFSEGSPSERLVPADANERIPIARRVVADRCLYGVDINPMAVEMAKLSLWLITVDANRPFTFLDHAFKCGDSLLGITSLEQLENFSLRPGASKQLGFATFDLRAHIDEATKKREALEAMPSDTPEQIATKAALYAEAEEAVAKLNAAADVLVAAELKGLKGRAYENEREASADHMMIYWAKGSHELQDYAHQRLAGHQCLHWTLVFPEVITMRGFDAMIGNPPFLGGRKISTILGGRYESAIKQTIIHGEKATINLVAYFLLRACNLLRRNGCLGLITTDSIRESETREYGLQRAFSLCKCFRAVSTKPWPGEAGVGISVLHFLYGDWGGLYYLDGKPVSGITSFLTCGTENKEAYPLSANRGFCSDGVKVQGIGFVLSPEEAENLRNKDPIYNDVVTRYVVGDDVNSDPLSIGRRWVINFQDRDKNEAQTYDSAWQIVVERVKPYRDTLTKQVHESCFWKFWDRREDFFNRVRSRSRFLVASKLSKYFAIVFGHPNFVYSEKTKVFDFSSFTAFAVLQSAFHTTWAAAQGSTTGETPAYVGSKCFDTFPFPNFFINHANGLVTTDVTHDRLDKIGEEYYTFRDHLLQNNGIGLTRVYNRLHDPDDQSNAINRLRYLVAEMDNHVADVYGWQDIDLGHDFHETRQGIRYTISDAARREVLDRLLAMNHQRHAEEEAHRIAHPAATPVKRGRKKKDASDDQMLIEL